MIIFKNAVSALLAWIGLTPEQVTTKIHEYETKKTLSETEIIKDFLDTIKRDTGKTLVRREDASMKKEREQKIIAKLKNWP